MTPSIHRGWMAMASLVALVAAADLAQAVHFVWMRDNVGAAVACVGFLLGVVAVVGARQEALR